MFDEVNLTPSPERRGAVERAWTQLTGPGATLSAAQRTDIIAGARRAWAGADSPDTAAGIIGVATHWLAVDAEGISRALVTQFAEQGLAVEQYLEVVGVVSRLSNVDWYMRAIGSPYPELARVEDRPPTRNIHPDAAITDSWVPMLGLASAPRTLDALPDEGEALRDLHEPMYINMSSIEDWKLADTLDRTQIEFLAARTSYLNECFY